MKKKLHVSGVIFRITTWIWPNYSQMPYPILAYLIRNFGRWAGSSNTEEISRRRWEAFKRRTIKWWPILVFALIAIGVFIVGLLSRSDSFFFGFSQELLSELILVLILVLFLQKIITGDKTVHIRGYYKTSRSVDTPNNTEIAVYFENIGDVPIHEKRILVEVVFPDTVVPVKQKEWNSKIAKIINWTPLMEGEFLKAAYTNENPIFPYQRILIANYQFQQTKIIEDDGNNLLFYFRVCTDEASYPSPWKGTERFSEYYDGNFPLFGEVIVTEKKNRHMAINDTTVEFFSN